MPFSLGTQLSLQLAVKHESGSSDFDRDDTLWFSRAHLLEENDIEILSMVYSVSVFQMLKITSEVAF
jgi:hypothetical protein